MLLPAEEQGLLAGDGLWFVMQEASSGVFPG